MRERERESERARERESERALERESERARERESERAGEREKEGERVQAWACSLLVPVSKNRCRSLWGSQGTSSRGDAPDLSSYH